MFGVVTERPQLCLCVLTLLVLFLFLPTIDLGSYFSFSYASLPTLKSFSSNSAGGHAECEPQLKVYMYDWPRKFNFGMLKKNSSQQNLPWANSKIPQWPQRSGLKRQHSVEYWMMVYLLDNRAGKDQERAAVRVFDPDEADVFFVPFFASLSFNTHGRTMRDPETEIDKELQVEVVNMLKRSKYWKRSQGHNHLIVIHHPNAFRFLRDEVNTSVFIVADFGRYLPTISNLQKDVVAPYVHVVDSYVNDDSLDPYESRKILLYFRGRIQRKDDGVVRVKLARLLQNHDGVIFEDSIASTGGFEAAAKGMRSSRFCLHPAGDTPSSCRLFDAIVSHCVPIIVSDKIELPFEDEIDYQEFSLFFSVEEALQPGYLLKQLEGFQKERWLSMWTKLKQVAHYFEFQYPPIKDDAVNMIWKQVHRKLPAINSAINRNRRLKMPDWWN